MTAIGIGDAKKPPPPPYKPVKRNLRLTRMARNQTKRKTFFPLIMDLFIFAGCVHYFIVDTYNPTGTFTHQPTFPARHPTKIQVPVISIGTKFFLLMSSFFIHRAIENGRHHVVKRARFAMNHITFIRCMMLTYDFYVGVSGAIDLGDSNKAFYAVSFCNFVLEVMFTYCMFRMNQVAIHEINFVLNAMDDIEARNLPLVAPCSCGLFLGSDCSQCGVVTPDAEEDVPSA